MKLLIHAELVDAWSAESTICRGISIHTDRIKSTCSFLFFGDWLFTHCLTCITFSDRKLRCPLPECIYKCWQQSNLETHIRRQYVLFFFFLSFLTIIFINWCSFFPTQLQWKNICLYGWPRRVQLRILRSGGAYSSSKKLAWVYTWIPRRAQGRQTEEGHPCKSFPWSWGGFTGFYPSDCVSIFQVFFCGGIDLRIILVLANVHPSISQSLFFTTVMVFTFTFPFIFAFTLSSCSFRITTTTSSTKLRIPLILFTYVFLWWKRGITIHSHHVASHDFIIFHPYWKSDGPLLSHSQSKSSIHTHLHHSRLLAEH